MQNGKISKILTGTLISTLVSAGSVFAQESQSQTTPPEQPAMEKNSCKGSNGCNGKMDSKKETKKHSKKEAKNQNKGENKDDSQKDKNSCAGPNGCGSKK